MASYTTNYKLIKPAPADIYNIADFNSNADIIDAQLKLGAEGRELAQTANSTLTTVQNNIVTLLGRTSIILLVWAPANTQVQVQKGSTAFSGTVGSSMELRIGLPSVGTWQLTYTYGGTSYSRDVAVNYVGQNLVAAAPSLATAPWAYIAKLAEAGLARQAFKIGDSKSLTCSLGTYDVQIIAFDHDYLETPLPGRETAGLTLQMKSSTPQNYIYDSDTTHTGGWQNSEMRLTTLAQVYESMAADLRGAIKPVRKYTAKYGSYASQSTVDRLFLLSEYELTGYVTGSDQYHYNKMYEYYQAGHEAFKNYNYWTRSHYHENGGEQYVMIINSNNQTVTRYRCENKFGICFAFCI